LRDFADLSALVSVGLGEPSACSAGAGVVDGFEGANGTFAGFFDSELLE
jgi:hypothetical protein